MIDLEAVVAELTWLTPEPVYVGGAVVPLFLDDFGRSQMRPTEDVDCIVAHVVTRKGWWDLEAQLRRRRWSPDPDGPRCRYRSPGGAIVDLMPTDPDILGFGGRWYPLVAETARRLDLSTTTSILVPTPALLFACKLEAFSDRGRRDPWMSKDLEDIAAMLDGCQDLEIDVTGHPDDVREHIAQVLREIESSPTERDALRAQLPRGGDERRQLARIDALLARLTI